MANLFQVYEAPKDIGFKSSVLNDIIYAIPQIRPAMQSILRDINLKKAAEDKREDLWNDPKKYPKIDDAHFVRTFAYLIHECVSHVCCSQYWESRRN